MGLLEARDVAESATRATSAFLATMSHEIRTPLNAVVGAASLLEDTPLDDEQRESARVIAGSGDHLLHVINGILDYSKLEAGRVDLEQAPFDPAACALSAIDLVAGRRATKGLALTSDLDLPPYVLGDVARLRQVSSTCSPTRCTSRRRVAAWRCAAAPTPSGRLASRSSTPASASRPSSATGCSSPSCRRTPRPRAPTAAPGSGCRSPAASSSRWAASSPSTARPGAGRRSTSPSARRPSPSRPTRARPGRRRRAALPTAPLRVLVAEDDEVNRVLIERMLVRLGHRPGDRRRRSGQRWPRCAAATSTSSSSTSTCRCSTASAAARAITGIGRDPAGPTSSR